MAASSPVELTEAEKAFLPFMTNDLYEKNHSVIVTHFPLRQTVGQRLVDHGLLTIEEYVEMCRELNSPDNLAGSRLIRTLSRKGNDSMATFYKVLVSARGERDVDTILQRLEDAVPRSTESGTGDMDPISPSADLLPGKGQPLASHVDSDFKLVTERITEMSEDIQEIKKNMSDPELKERVTKLAMDVATTQTKVDQLLGVFTNIEAQLHCIVQSLPSVSLHLGPKLSELGSNESVYHTCPSSRTNSRGHQDLPAHPAVRGRSHTQPPTTLQFDLRHQPAERPASPISSDSKLDHVPEEASDLELSAQQGPEEGAETGDTSNPINLASPPVEELKTFTEETAPQTKRQRRRGNPFKGSFRTLLCVGGVQ